MDRRRNMLIGIVAGVLIVGALSYATGLTKLIRNHSGAWCVAQDCGENCVGLKRKLPRPLFENLSVYRIHWD